jgi:uncharacterized repeat protein (TIGR03803 family)
MRSFYLGVTVGCLMVMATLRLSAAQLQEVYSFPTSPTPVSGLIQAGDGAFYGVTFAGGDYGQGSVFRVTTNGSMATVASFDYTNGANPVGALALGDDGALYGVAQHGGTNGFGLVFQATTSGTIHALVTFERPYEPHYYQQTALVQGKDGAFYGTDNGQSPSLFRVATNGQMTIVADLYNSNEIDYSYNIGTPVQGDADAWYFTAHVLWQTNWSGGAVCRVTTNGEFQVVAFVPTFIGEEYLGNSLCPRLTTGLDGALYGTMGANEESGGTIFRVTIIRLLRPQYQLVTWILGIALGC